MGRASPSSAIAALYGGTPATSGDAITALTKRLTGMTFSAAHRAALQTFLGEPAEHADGELDAAVVTDPLAALILDAPHHALR